MKALLFLIFIVVPAAELTLLFLASQVIGLPLTFLLIIFTGILGASLAKREGAAALQKVREDSAMGRVPGDSIIEGLLVLAAGLLLLTPGFISDTTGFLLLARPIRRKIVGPIRGWFKKRMIENRGNFFIFRR